VYGAVQTLRGRTLDPSMSEALLDMIDAESVRLANLVEEILLTSQIDSEQLRLERASVDPRAVIDAATQTVGRHEVILDVPTATPAACGDPEKVRQVVANLVENAVKYAGGPVTVRSREVRDSVRFEIADSGPGIARQEQQRIFEKFYRLDPHMRQGVRGTGLGLYICRELVHRMQGRIGVDSTEGRGSTFWFELPRY
jgi:signal transduction histidine kinase